MNIDQYLGNITQLFNTGQAREHSYRSDLQVLISNILPDVLVTNEPARVSCGAPDYMLTKKEIPVGYIEAKDIGVDLDSKNLKEQFERYKAGLSNLIITDYLKFRFYKDGEFIMEISIAELVDGAIKPKQENFNQFIHLVENFVLTVSQNIKSPSRLATMMAGKAKLMADVIEKSLNKDDDEDKRSNLKSQMLSFKQRLIHDITNKGFADIYAQTIAYGMFAARYHDPTLETFSRIEAAQLIPKSNPFLRKLFQDIAGYDLDERLVWIVDELVNIFLASDVMKIMRNFGKATKQDDPVVHFYETFLGEYNPALRKSRGVWYTPQPVVNFIVRAVDDTLKNEFKLSQGLADTSKTKITVKVPTHDKRFSSGFRDHEQEVHKVQILDPATGTATFLSEVVRQIHTKFKGQEGLWPQYAKKDLIPRLNGFELLMASYAMAHLKMDMLLTETGYKSSDEQRLRIFLTNSLEEAHPDTSTLFSSLLSEEADQANAIKRDAPVMCILGNPPYSVSSSNKSKWIENLTSDYKRNLKERNIQPLSDDYIKFIRLGQYLIDRNGSGVLAYITNNSFLDGLIHRQMRKFLLLSFDEIYVLNLHGNSKRKEISPDGSVDQNVFDIQQGVSINIFIKSGKLEKGQLGKVLYHDLWGTRESKYEFLNSQNLKSIDWEELLTAKPNYFFVKKDFKGKEQYENSFNICELMPLNGNGIKTQRDDASICFSQSECDILYKDFKNLTESEIKIKYGFKDVRDWKVNYAKEDAKHNPIIAKKLMYRPMDYRYMNYTGKTKGMMGYPRYSIMKHFLYENKGLILSRQFGAGKHFICFSTNTIVEISSQPYAPYNVFPLYLYDDENSTSRTSNLNKDIVKIIASKINLKFIDDIKLGNELDEREIFTPLEIFDYVYAILHSRTYRNNYKEFLKIDFPKIPYPLSGKDFKKASKLGAKLREFHSLENIENNNFITLFPLPGNNIITRKLTKRSPGYEPINPETGRVWINDEQYFDKVPLKAWEFYIGGYQPAQKWLKDRKGRELSTEEIFHYQKIIVSLVETDRIMNEIDEVLYENKEVKVNNL